MKSLQFLIFSMCLLGACKRSDKRIIEEAIDARGKYFSMDSLNGLIVQARYLPPQLLALKESKERKIESPDYSGLKKEFSDQFLFKVNLKWTENIDFLKYDLQNQNEYYERLNYLTTRAGLDFRLVDGKDTINSAFCQVERTYGQTPFLTLLVAFPRIEKIKNPILIYNAAVWSRGICKMKFENQIFN